MNYESDSDSPGYGAPPIRLGLLQSIQTPVAGIFSPLQQSTSKDQRDILGSQPYHMITPNFFRSETSVSSSSAKGRYHSSDITDYVLPIPSGSVPFVPSHYSEYETKPMDITDSSSTDEHNLQHHLNRAWKQQNISETETPNYFKSMTSRSEINPHIVSQSNYVSSLTPLNQTQTEEVIHQTIQEQTSEFDNIISTIHLIKEYNKSPFVPHQGRDGIANLIEGLRYCLGSYIAQYQQS